MLRTVKPHGVQKAQGSSNKAWQMAFRIWETDEKLFLGSTKTLLFTPANLCPMSSCTRRKLAFSLSDGLCSIHTHQNVLQHFGAVYFLIHLYIVAILL